MREAGNSHDPKTWSSQQTFSVRQIFINIEREGKGEGEGEEREGRREREYPVSAPVHKG